MRSAERNRPEDDRDLKQRTLGVADRLLPQQSFRRGLMTLVGGSALSQAVLICSYPLLTRLRTPNDFGVFAVYGAIVLTLVVASALRLEAAIPIASDSEEQALIRIALMLIALTTAVTSAALWVFSGEIIDLLELPQLAGLLWTIPIGLLAGGLFQLGNHTLVRERRFTEMARVRVTQSVATVATQIALAFATTGPGALLLGDGVGRATSTLAIADLKRRRQRVAAARSGYRQTLTKYKRFPQFAFPAAMLGSLSLHAPAVVLAAAYGPAVAGWFALAQRVLNLPLQLIGQSAAQAYLAESSGMVRALDFVSLRALTQKIATRFFLIGLPGAILLLAFGGPLFSIAFGNEWREAGLYGQLLAGALLAQFTIFPIAHALNTLGLQHWQLGWDIGRATLSIGGIALAATLGTGPALAVGLYAAATAVSYSVLAIMVWRAVVQAEHNGHSRGTSDG